MKKLIVCIAALGFILIGSCKKDSTPTTTDCSTVAAAYSANLQPLVTAKCATAGCHAAGSSNGDFTTYAGLFAKFQSGSLKREVITDKSMPQNGSLSAAELQIFECWISAGGPDN